MGENEKIYLEGRYHRLYGEGEIIFAKRDESPEVIKENYYLIKKIIPTELGTCSKNLEIILAGINGSYKKKTFKVTKECLEQMKKLIF